MPSHTHHDNVVEVWTTKPSQPTTHLVRAKDCSVGTVRLCKYMYYYPIHVDNGNFPRRTRI